MRIAFYIDSMNGFGGAQRVISVLSNAFSKDENNEVAIFLSGATTDSVYHLENVKKYAYVEKSSGAICKLKKMAAIRRETKKFKPDIVISFLTMTNIMTILTLAFTGIPVIVSERNDPDKCTDKEKKLSKMFYKYSSSVVVQTEDIKNKISKIFKKEIAVIPNPLQEFDFEKNSYEQTRKIVAVGRINVQKNYPMMLKAFKLFSAKHCDYTLNIYGAGDKLEEYKALAKELNIDENVHFMGNKPNPLENELDAEMYLMSSDFEGMPNALAEAMSVGFPCISTDCDGGGAAFLIENGVNGILTEKANEKAFCEAMEKVSGDREFAEKLGTQAKFIKNKLNTQAVIQMWTEIINKYKK